MVRARRLHFVTFATIMLPATNGTTRRCMAHIFVSYTSSDRLKAFWIGQELEKLGHKPRIHEWEIPAGGNIPAWMEQRHHDADHVLLVVSKAYLAAPYSNWERQAAQWASADKRPNFALPVFIEDCEAPTLVAHIKRCDLYGLSEEEARAKLAAYLAPAAKPSVPVAFSGSANPGAPSARVALSVRSHVVTGTYYAVSNIPIGVPRHFLGRDEELAKIKTELANDKGPVAITALHGLRGVGKTTLAAAYAERHRADYRATWWIRAQTESTMRADLVALGVQLGWVATDEKEEPALSVVMGRLRDEGEGILLIYDNAIDEKSITPHLPRGGAAQVIVTSNSDVWRRLAAPVEIQVWPKEVGADYLIARTGRKQERETALALSETLGGLALAHEQAAAYCERLDVSLNEYLRRFEAAPTRMLGDERDAPAAHNYGETALKSFELGIEQASKLNPAAAPLIEHVALLAPEPIPMFLFAEAREEFGEPLASALAGDGLDEAVAALRTFALIDREIIRDERQPAIATDTIRLHRLVRQVVVSRLDRAMRDKIGRAILKAMVAVYPARVWDKPETWPRARRLDGLVPALMGESVLFSVGPGREGMILLERLASYKAEVLSVLDEALLLYKQALSINKTLDKEENEDTAGILNNIAQVQEQLGNLSPARLQFKRALKIYEKVLGSDHPYTATSLINLGRVLQRQRSFGEARKCFDRAIAIDRKRFGPNHPEVATDLSNLGGLLYDEGDYAGARKILESAVNICQQALGAGHPNTNDARRQLAVVMMADDRPNEALALVQRALGFHDEVLGRDHPRTKDSARVAASALETLNRSDEAAALREKYNV